MTDDYEKFKSDIYAITSIDLNKYKETQMKRRIDTLIKKNGINSYDDYVGHIKVNERMYEEFVNYLTINVSEFFRNPSQWEQLENDVLPALIKSSKGALNIWSAACSSGEEPYTIAMILAEHLPISKFNIIATDIDKQVLKKAEKGEFSIRDITAIPSKYFKKYFSKIDNNRYKIHKDIRSTITFKQHNLLKDVYPYNIDLIICRNVVIYFTEAAKNEIYKKFTHSLKDNGVLFVGNTEKIIRCNDVGFKQYESIFYKKL